MISDCAGVLYVKQTTADLSILCYLTMCFSQWRWFLQALLLLSGFSWCSCHSNILFTFLSQVFHIFSTGNWCVKAISPLKEKKVNISDLSEKVIKVIFFPSWAILAEEIQLFFFWDIDAVLQYYINTSSNINWSFTDHACKETFNLVF